MSDRLEGYKIEIIYNDDPQLKEDGQPFKHPKQYIAHAPAIEGSKVFASSPEEVLNKIIVFLDSRAREFFRQNLITLKRVIDEEGEDEDREVVISEGEVIGIYDKPNQARDRGQEDDLVGKKS
ncbi:MAG: hypothetical protein GPJ54_11600 [Candidatus Heimdallarchaeota archaeon]|nr:hypothetical protein [Candidatus Heimdallarchaeota archaeon]